MTETDANYTTAEPITSAETTAGHPPKNIEGFQAPSEMGTSYINEPLKGFLDTPVPSISKKRYLYLASEFAILFVVLPVVMFVMIRFQILRGMLIPTLWIWAAICSVYLLFFSKSFSKRRFFGFKSAFENYPRVVILFLLGALVLTIIRLLTDASLILHLPRWRPWLWVMIICLYPIFSVFSQGIIYRCFLFHRYRPLFKTDLGILILGAAVFGFGHIVMGNWQAPALTFLGGLFFGWTYLQSKSGILASFEHALYGCFMFTIGLNNWIFAGSQLMANRVAGG